MGGPRGLLHWAAGILELAFAEARRRLTVVARLAGLLLEGRSGCSQQRFVQLAQSWSVLALDLLRVGLCLLSTLVCSEVRIGVARRSLMVVSRLILTSSLAEHSVLAIVNYY